MNNSACAPPGGPSRRTVIGAAAWSVPVITLATATPAFAASLDPRMSFTRFSADQRKQAVVVKWGAMVSGVPSASASLLIQLYTEGGDQLGSETVPVSLSPKDSGQVSLPVAADAGAHHVTATLTSPEIPSVSTSTNL